MHWNINCRGIAQISTELNIHIDEIYPKEFFFLDFVTHFPLNLKKVLRLSISIKIYHYYTYNFDFLQIHFK